MAYAPSSESDPGQIHSTGITELYVPDSPALDVCFVHGFTGHPELTWRSKKRLKRQAPSEPTTNSPSKRKLVNFLPRSRTSSSRESASTESTTTTGEYLYWPRDLVPQIIPDARVLTFGYDTHIRHSFSHPPSCNRLIDHGGDFLCALEDYRRLDPSRPLLFIAHSLGGLVVKETLRQSKSYEQDQPSRALVYSNTVGAIFFGTPHAGADPLNAVHHCLIGLIKLLTFKVNDEIVQTLKPNAERLVLLNEDFLKMTRARNWRIHSFQEELPQLGLGKKVVDDFSSRINDRQHERITHIQANHVDMCRFDGLGDPEFHKVQAALQFMRNSVRERSALVTGAPNDHHSIGSATPSPQASLTPEQKEKILEKLKFDAVESRYVSLKVAQTRTCQWLPKSDTYKKWQDATKLVDHHGFLWIKGKPGAGKSIMMKYGLFQKAKRTMTGSLVISFFFNARGDKLERSTEGLYRSLLIQLLQGLSETPLDTEALAPLLAMPDNNPWPIEALKQAFESVILQAGSISLCCYIDALDECSEDEIREMIYFFEDIGERALESNFIFRVCFSSRHYPHITIRNGLQITLEHELDHGNDINKYIQSKLKIKEIARKEEIAAEVLKRSKHIFLWAALVVDILNKEYDKGLNPTLKRLKQIPVGLHRLFENILSRDNENIDELVLCLQWILFAKRPLRPEELYFAVQLGLDPPNSSFWNQNYITTGTIDRFNLNVSKGLAEITQKQSTVQFIHESVRDYLLREDGLRTLLKHRKDITGDVEGFSNETLKEACLAQLNDQMESEISIPDKLTKASSPMETSLREETKAKFPLLEYAVNHVLSHANSAQKGGIDQAGLLSTFPHERWITFDNLLQKRQTRRHSSDAPLIYLFAEQNLPHLIQIHPERHLGLTLSTKSERYSPLISAAIALGAHGAIRTLAIEAAKHSIGPTNDILIGKIEEELGDLSHIKSDLDNVLWRNLDGETALMILKSISLIDALLDGFAPSVSGQHKTWFINRFIKFPSVDLAKRLSCYSDSWLDFTDHSGHTALSLAVEKDMVELAEYLLSQTANPNLKDEWGRVPLALANSVEMVRTLHKHGAKLYDLSIGGNNLLHCLSERGTPEILPLMEYALGELGIPIDTKTRSGRTPLSLAVTSGSVEIVQFLCNFDKTSIDLADYEGRTPLSYAAGTSHMGVVQYLLELGAQPNSPDKLGRTPIFHASDTAIQDPLNVEVLLGQPSTDPNYANIHGMTPLLQAAYWSYTDKLQLLLNDQRTNTAMKCKKGRTVISHADAYNTTKSTLTLLLKIPSLDPDEPDFEGRTPLMYACEQWHPSKLRQLLESGKVDVNAKDDRGWTPIWYIIRSHGRRGEGMESMSLLLTSKMVNPLVAIAGYTPLDFAKSVFCPARREECWPKVVEILSSYVEKWIALNPGETQNVPTCLR